MQTMVLFQCQYCYLTSFAQKAAHWGTEHLEVAEKTESLSVVGVEKMGFQLGAVVEIQGAVSLYL